MESQRAEICLKIVSVLPARARAPFERGPRFGMVCFVDDYHIPLCLTKGRDPTFSLAQKVKADDISSPTHGELAPFSLPRDIAHFANGNCLGQRTLHPGAVGETRSARPFL